VTNRKQLESLLNEVTGRDWTLKLTAKEDLATKKTKFASEAEDYKDDPLIREALEVFKGHIKR
jgi:hypothetical protein